MEQPTIDRRAARTRTRLQHALLHLIRTRGYEAISIKEICETAHVGRSTFYAHFADKHDLKRSGLEHLRRELRARQQEARASAQAAADQRFGFSGALFVHARDHLDVYRALGGGAGAAVALERLHRILAELVRDELAFMSRNVPATDDAVPREFAVQYLVGALLAVLIWWLESGARLPPERVDAIFRRLATKGAGHIDDRCDAPMPCER